MNQLHIFSILTQPVAFVGKFDYIIAFVAEVLGGQSEPTSYSLHTSPSVHLFPSAMTLLQPAAIRLDWLNGFGQHDEGEAEERGGEEAWGPPRYWQSGSNNTATAARCIGEARPSPCRWPHKRLAEQKGIL